MEINKTYWVKHLPKKETKKNQILLTHTSSSIQEYFTKIQQRFNGKYPSIFTYTIDKEGNIYQHYDSKHHSIIFGDKQIDQQIISIGLENEGWLEIKPKSNDFFDWKGNIYKGEKIDKMWRGHKLWAVYTSEQINSMCELIRVLINKHNIEPNFSGDNLPIKNAKRFSGILNRSNYYKMFYDLSPACNFDEIKEKIK